MKIKSVDYNNRRKTFSVVTTKRTYEFPYAKTEPQPQRGNYVRKIFVDEELGNEGFTYVLESGEEGSIHIDHVLEYNQDADYMMELLSYNLTVALQECLDSSSLSKRELTRRLNTSPAQLYRLLDPVASRKAIAQKITVLHLLDCDVQLRVRDRSGNKIVECTA
jgi:hypothetical protein